MKLKLDITPDLAAMMAAEIRAGEKAVTAATREAGTSLKTAWRAQITGAGLGPRLPAILQRGERVLSRREVAEAQRGGGRTAGGVTVNMSITTPDTDSFRRSQGQITAEMSRAIERARRNR